MLFNVLNRHTRVYYGDKHYSKQHKSVRSLRKFVEFLDQRHSSISIFGLLLHSLMEITSVVIYIWVLQINRSQNIKKFTWGTSMFNVEVILNIIFFLEWILLFFLEEDKKQYFFSWLSFVNVMTSVPMIVLGVGAIFDSNYRHGWVPMYLRVWWINNCLCILLDYPQIVYFMVDIYRETCRFFSRLLAVIFTCIGTFQMVQSCTGDYIDLFDSSYLMIVTFDTLGYGDTFPSTTPSRLLMTVLVLIGISYFLPLFQRLALIGEKRQYYRTYKSGWLRSSHKHVVICGEFSDLGFDILIRNFYSGWRKYLSTCIVFMFPKAYSAEVQLTANLPWYKGRVHLMVGDPTKEVDLRRAGAKSADAIFLFGNTRSAAYYRDYDIIEQSLAVGLFDLELPQLLMLRRSRTMKQIAPYAASALEIERTVHHLLGLSMVNPGIIPFIINLMNTYEPMSLDMPHACHWIEQYEYSIRNDLYDIDVVDTLRGREFRTLARSFFEYDITLIGVLDAHYTVKLNPIEVIPNAKKLLLIARSMKAVHDATAAISSDFEQTFGEEMLMALSPNERARAKNGFKPNSQRTYQEWDSKTPSPNDQASDDFDHYDHCGDTMPYASNLAVGNAQSSARKPHCNKNANLNKETECLLRINDAFGCEKHFLMIDLSSAKGKDNTTRYALESHLAALAHDVYSVMRPIRQVYPQSDIILLTNDVSFAPYFTDVWGFNEEAGPLKYILGCGLNTTELMRCNLQECAGCCIFFAGDISREGSTAAMSMLVVLSIHNILNGAPPFPVVVELEGLINLSLFPPVAEDAELRSKARMDIVFEPNFLIGNAISREMLLPALQRTYFMEEFIDVMNAMINGYANNQPTLSQLSLSMCVVELGTYEDVINYCLRAGFLPIALYRCIRDAKNPSLDGFRYILTNPPKYLGVDQAVDIVYYLIPQ
ncbi:unnamed protein product [Phytomonas sp. Hart1]|nr:unnamed protein product [Phytomonas sp. Hart1]|eukprot:CCW71333.1 unnamed protein product [Phytomonas sp. isolate Hart1]